MSATAVPRGSASGNRRSWPKASPLPPRTSFALKSDQDVAERLTEVLTAITGKAKPDPRPVRGGVELYNVLRKWGAQTSQGHGRASWRQLAQQLYPDVATVEDAMRKHSSMYRATKRLEAAGVARITAWKGPCGEWRGIYWELIDEPADASKLGGTTCPRSSTGCSHGSAWQPPSRPRDVCGVKVQHTPLRARKPGLTRLAPYRFRTGHGSICRLELEFDRPVPRRAPFFEPTLLASPVVLPTDVGRTTEPPWPDDRDDSAKRSSECARRDQERHDRVADERRDVQAAIERSLNSAARAERRAALERAAAALVGLPVPHQAHYQRPPSRQEIESWAALEAERLKALERMAGVTFPSYGQVADVFMLARGPSVAHARRRTRDLIETAARRYDRFALRLDDDGAPPAPPTAMAFVVELALSERGESIGIAGKELHHAGHRLRRRWKASHRDELDAAARKRRERRIHRRAEELASGLLVMQLGPRRRVDWLTECEHPSVRREHRHDRDPRVWRKWEWDRLADEETEAEQLALALSEEEPRA